MHYVCKADPPVRKTGFHFIIISPREFIAQDG
jgi:hypothetical protein